MFGNRSGSCFLVVIIFCFVLSYLFVLEKDLSRCQQGHKKGKFLGQSRNVQVRSREVGRKGRNQTRALVETWAPVVPLSISAKFSIKSTKLTKI